MLIGLLLLLTLVVLQLLNRLLYKDLCSPLSFLSVFWVAPWLLSYTELSGLQTGSSGAGSAITLACTLILLATCMLPWAINRGSPLPVLLNRHLSLASVSFFGIVTAAAFFMLMVIFLEFSSESLPLLDFLSKDVSDPYSYLTGKESPLQIVAFGIHAVSLYIFLLFLISKGFVKRAVLFTLISIILLIGVVKASKSDIFIPLLSFGVIFYYCRIHGKSDASNPSQRSSRGAMLYILLGCTGMLLLPWITAIRLEGINSSFSYASLIDFQSPPGINDSIREFFSIVYGYTALGFENFRRFVDAYAGEYRYGTSFFRPLFSALMQGAHVDGWKLPYEELHHVSEAANTGTFLLSLYIEGGALFCLLGACAYGLLINILYIRLRSRGSLVDLAIYTFMLYPWSWMFFTNAFSVLAIFSNVIYIILLSAIFIRRPVRALRT